MLIADRGYDHDRYRRLVWQRGVKPIIARRKTHHGSGLGRHRWVVERTFAWLHNRRRLLIRTGRRDDIHEGFLALACCLICWRRLETSLSYELSMRRRTVSAMLSSASTTSSSGARVSISAVAPARSSGSTFAKS
jgi:transposase